MKVSLSEYKIPLGVTSVGLLLAGGLATAPALLAESDSEILTKKNATDIAALTETIEKQTALLDSRFASAASASAGNHKDLEVQVITLNKAVSNLSNSVRNKVASTTDTAELQGSMKFADGRLVNLEKAVTRLHRKQKTHIESTAENSQSDDANKLANLESRLVILEKAVTRLHQRQMKAKSDTPILLSSVTANGNLKSTSGGDTEAQNLAVITDTKATTQTVEQAPERQEVAAASPQPESAFTADLERLEKIVRQMSSIQSGGHATGGRSISRNSLSGGINNRDDSSLQVRHLERTLTQLDRRLNMLEKREQEQEVAVDQLFEIRDYIDSLLNGIE